MDFVNKEFFASSWEQLSDDLLKTPIAAAGAVFLLYFIFFGIPVLILCCILRCFERYNLIHFQIK